MSKDIMDINLDELIDSLEKEAEVSNAVAEEKDAETLASNELEQLLSKEASEKTTNETGENVDMNKQAEEAGKALAADIKDALLKQANQIVPDNAVLVAEQDSQTEATPQGRVNEVLKGLVEEAARRGAIDEDALVENATSGADEAAAEGAAEAAVKSDEVEKAAAVDALVSEGHTFDEAVELVKAAEQEIYFEQVKTASVHALIEEGIEFEDAVALVKQATEVETPEAKLEKAAMGSLLKNLAGKASTGAKEVYGKAGAKAKELASKIDVNAIKANAKSKAEAAKATVMANPKTSAGIAAGVGAAGVGGAAYKYSGQEKAAAVSDLVDQGYDFDTALEAINKLTAE